MTKIKNSAKMATRTFTLNECVGIRVNELLFLNRIARKDLAAVLEVSAPTVTRKLHGDIAWSLDDVYRVADFFSVPVESLLPRRVESPLDYEKSPSSEEKGDHRYVVAGAGFEPTTSGL